MSHCSIVNAVAGNLKTHWVVEKEHPKEHPDEHDYDVRDVLLFERVNGSDGPRK